jgi:8-oxo-dGTP pyrophosphatase MutT (NUDIX family)
MRIIKVFDSKNYKNDWSKFKRDSVRAIIFSNNEIVMIKSKKFGEYKFPGGGIEKNESHFEALVREVKEETGLHIIIDSIKKYGKTLIIRKGTSQNEIFEQESFYYSCGVQNNLISQPQYDEGYETENKYSLVYVSLEKAIESNKKLLNISEIPWVERDLTVLIELQNNFTE